MRTANIAWVAVVVVVLIGGWWYFMRGADMPAEESSTMTETQDKVGQTGMEEGDAVPVLSVSSDAALGDYLVASNGMTLYLYTKDTSGVSNCYDACAVAWPPYMRAASGTLVAGAGVSGAITTVMRTDGGEQIAYNGVPLYFWKDDKKAGDTTGQNVGGVWFVVKP